MNELAEAVKKTLVDRLNTPLFGFIAISWVMFNWDNILFVIFSKLTIEQRISGLRAMEFFYCKTVILPAVTGFVLSIAFPYLQVLISVFQMAAQKINDKITLDRERLECEAVMHLAAVRAKANNSVKIATAHEDRLLAMAEDEASKIRFNTNNLEVKFNSLNDDIVNKENELGNLKSYIEQNELDIGDMEKKIQKLEERHGEFEHVINYFNEYKAEANKLASTIISLKDTLTKAGTIKGVVEENGRRKFPLKPFEFKNGVNEEYLLNELGVSLGIIYSSIGKLQSVGKNTRFDS